MKVFGNEAAKIIVFLTVFGFAAASVPAQKINDDLQQPKTTPKKTTKPVQPKKKKPGKIVRKTKTPTTNPATTPTTTPANTTANTTVTTPANNPAAVPAITQPVVVQTPSEIFTRFVNFQQSAGVTTKDWESVVSQTSATLQTNPNDKAVKAQLFFAQGQLAFIRNDFSNALIHFNAASDVLPESALPHYGIGNVYLLTKQPNEAERAFEKAIKIDKNFALAYKGIGDALTAQRKTKKAQEYFKEAAKIGLSGTNGVTTQQPNVSTTPGNQISQNSITTPIIQETPYDIELKNARYLTAQKRWQDSLDKLTPLSQSNPTADVFIAMGDNYLGMETWLSAQQAFRKATEIAPGSALAFFKLGSVLFRLNEFQSSSESFEKSLILDQQGKFIDRKEAREMADRASEKAKEAKDGKKKKFLGLG